MDREEGPSHLSRKSSSTAPLSHSYPYPYPSPYSDYVSNARTTLRWYYTVLYSTGMAWKSMQRTQDLPIAMNLIGWCLIVMSGTCTTIAGMSSQTFYSWNFCLHYLSAPHSMSTCHHITATACPHHLIGCTDTLLRGTLDSLSRVPCLSSCPVMDTMTLYSVLELSLHACQPLINLH